MWLRRSVIWRKDQHFLQSDTHGLLSVESIPPGQMCLTCVFFVKCEAAHPVVSVALPSGSLHVLSFCFLSAHKEDIKWAHSRQMSDRRAHCWWQTQKKANPQNYSQPLSRLLCNLFFSHMPSGWRPVWSVWLRGYSSRARLPASGRPLDYRAAAEPAGRSSLILYHQVHLLRLCTARFPADALGWLKPSVQSNEFYTLPL